MTDLYLALTAFALSFPALAILLKLDALRRRRRFEARRRRRAGDVRLPVHDEEWRP